MRAAANTKSIWQAVDELERRRGLHDPLVTLYRKAADVHTSTTAEFLEWTRLARDFLAIVKRQSVLGQLRGTVPMLIGTSSPLTNDDVVLNFVGEADPIPTAQLGGDTKIAQPDTLAGIVGCRKSWSEAATIARCRCL